MPQRSEDGIGEAFARMQQSLRDYLRKRLRDPAQAEDLLQDVFVKALASARAGRRVDNLTGWLYAAARTTLIDHYRATGAPLEALADDVPAAEDDELQLHQELSACLGPFVRQLPPLYRDTLIRADIQGETLRSLAEQQNVSVSAIKSRAARGRAMLREKLLACCRVEMRDGLVSDYQRNSPSACGGECS